MGGLELRGIRQLLEIELIGAKPDIEFRIEVVTALLALLPIPDMTLIVVICAQGVTIMVSMATILGEGKQRIFAVIVTDPVATALCFCELPGLAAKTASRLVRFRFSWCYHLFSFQRPASVAARSATIYMLFLGAPADMQGMISPYNLPASRKLKYPVLLKMMWSNSSMPTISPAALSWAVMLMSLCDGSTPPVG